MTASRRSPTHGQLRHSPRARCKRDQLWSSRRSAQYRSSIAGTTERPRSSQEKANQRLERQLLLPLGESSSRPGIQSRCGPAAPRTAAVPSSPPRDRCARADRRSGSRTAGVDRRTARSTGAVLRRAPAREPRLGRHHRAAKLLQQSRLSDPRPRRGAARPGLPSRLSPRFRERLDLATPTDEEIRTRRAARPSPRSRRHGTARSAHRTDVRSGPAGSTANPSRSRRRSRRSAGSPARRARVIAAAVCGVTPTRSSAAGIDGAPARRRARWMPTRTSSGIRCSTPRWFVRATDATTSRAVPHRARRALSSLARV